MKVRPKWIIEKRNQSLDQLSLESSSQSVDLKLWEPMIVGIVYMTALRGFLMIVLGGFILFVPESITADSATVPPTQQDYFERQMKNLCGLILQIFSVPLKNVSLLSLVILLCLPKGYWNKEVEISKKTNRVTD